MTCDACTDVPRVRVAFLQTEEAVEKELLIQEKDKLYVELKNILARQPGPEVRCRVVPSRFASSSPACRRASCVVRRVAS